MSLVTPTTFELKGRHVLAGLIAFFLIVISVDLYFSTLAYKTFSGQAADNPYEAGLLFNRTLAQRRAEAALGWTAAVTQSAGLVELTFTDKTSAPIEGLRVSGTLTRPATETGRLAVTFTTNGEGRYKAALPAHGAWDLHATAVNADGKAFDVDSRLVAP
jgi:nitrogen fixation protein FixH